MQHLDALSVWLCTPGAQLCQTMARLSRAIALQCTHVGGQSPTCMLAYHPVAYEPSRVEKKHCTTMFFSNTARESEYRPWGLYVQFPPWRFSIRFISNTSHNGGRLTDRSMARCSLSFIRQKIYTNY